MGGGGFQVEVRQGIKSSHWAYGETASSHASKLNLNIKKKLLKLC